jgi:hypothetical protein
LVEKKDDDYACCVEGLMDGYIIASFTKPK